jgi:hypothetical protein
MNLRGAIVVSLLLAGCGSEAPAPDKPTWVDDVQPLLQANCFHCHGPTHDQGIDQFRWDVYNFDKDPKYTELGFPPSAFNSPEIPLESSQILLRIAPPPATPPTPVMPPPPAIPLDTRQIAVIQNWVNDNFLQGQHNPNHKPRIAWVAKPLFEVVDDDHDQVLGQLDCSGKKVQLDHSGGWTLPDGVSPPCTARLYDGFEEGGGDLQ